MKVLEIDKEACVKKTYRGNVYEDVSKADKQIKRIIHDHRRYGRKVSSRLHSYKCPVCRKYHIGKRAN